MRRYLIRGCLVILVSAFCLLGFEAGGADAPADKESLRYDGKPFEYWRTYMRTELKAERRIDALRALAAFGARGHAQSAAAAIVDVVKEDYGEDAYGDGEHPTPDQKVLETAKEAIVKIGPAGFEIVLRNAKDANVRLFADYVYFGHPRLYQKVRVLSASAVRTLLDYVQGDDLEIWKFAVELLGVGISNYAPTKENALNAIRAEKNAARLVNALIEIVERDCSCSAMYVLKLLGPQAKLAAVALVKARLGGSAFKFDLLEEVLFEETLKAIGAETKELLPEITQGLKSQKVEVRTRAAKWLAEIGPQAKPALPALREAAKAPEAPLREAAAAAIAKIEAKEQK